MKTANLTKMTLCVILALAMCFALIACDSGDGGSSSNESSNGSSVGSSTFDVGSDAVADEAAGAGEWDPTYTVNLKVVGGGDSILFNGKVTLKSPTMWANEFLRAAVSDKGLAQSGIEIGFIETIGDFTNNSTDGIYWLYTVNGISPMVGSNQFQLRDGDYMLWEYKVFEETTPPPAATGDWAFTVGSDAVNDEAAGAGEWDPVYTVNLKVVGGGDAILFNGKVTLKSPTMWANEFLRSAISDKGLAQSGIEIGFVDTIGDFTNNSTDGIFWLYTVNGISPMVGSNQFQLRDGDYMLWEYKGFE